MWRGGGLNVMQLNLGHFFIFLFGQWKSRQANKDGSQSQKTRELNCGHVGEFRKRTGAFTSLRTPSHSLSQGHNIDSILLWFMLAPCRRGPALPWPPLLLKITLKGSSQRGGIRLPLQLISEPYMQYSFKSPLWALCYSPPPHCLTGVIFVSSLGTVCSLRANCQLS